MKKELLIALWVAILSTASNVWAIPLNAINARGQKTPSLEKVRPIGTAKMLRDKTIVLKLRAETDGTIEHAEFRYAKDDQKYAEIIKHLGGLKLGQEKLVPPFPEKAR